MSEENWYKVDNVAKVFLATHNARDTRTMRVSATLTEKIDPDLLQQALLSVIETRKLFQVRIRRGLFWHYLEPTNAVPKVCEEYERPCPKMYGRRDKQLLHYSVTYYHNRINLEVFHALSDGTGILDFLNTLVIKYLKLKYPKDLSLQDAVLTTQSASADREENSYRQFYEKNEKVLSGDSIRRAYHIRGGKLPYDQLQFFEISMESAVVLARAKEIGVGVTALVAARLMMAIYRDMPLLKKKQPISLSIPVNLRNYYPSETSRNFFISIMLIHSFSGEETEESLAAELHRQMKEELQPDQIRAAMNRNQKCEQLPWVRVVPLAIKQPYIRMAARKNNRKCSAVLSNLGRMQPPKEAEKYVTGYTALCSHNELFMTVYTYHDRMCLGITSGYRSTSVLKNFLRSFSSEEHEIEIQASEVVRI